MVRILHVLPSADPQAGGPIEGALRAGQVWKGQGHDQELVTLDDAHAAFLDDVPARVHALGPPKGGKTPWGHYGFVPGFTAWIRQNARNYDAVIVSGLWNYSTMGARRALVGGKTPYFVFTHGMLDPWFKQTYPRKHLAKQAFWLFNEGPLLRGARRVLFTTEDERILAKNQFWPYRLKAEVVGYGTADAPDGSERQRAAFHHRVPMLKGRRFFLFLSRIHPKKGIDLLISGYAAVARAHSDLDLVIAGPDQIGLVAELAAQVEALGLGDRVHFCGMLQGDEKWGAFRACEAFTLTSHQENFGVVVAEAMACSKPVLITDKINIWREIETDGGGLVETDTEIGARTLLTKFLALPPSEQNAMGSRARASFEKRYTIEAAAGQLMAVIEREIVVER